MLQKDTMKLFEAHGTMTAQVIDTDMVEPFALGETPNQTAQKLQERANHLHTVLTAVVDYARVIVDDIAHNTWVSSDALALLQSMANDISDLTGVIEKIALGIAPDAVVDTAPEKPVRIKELIAEHLDELIGKDFQTLANWARNHGIQSRGMGAFWSEFTGAMVRRGLTIKISPVFTPGEELPNQPG